MTFNPTHRHKKLGTEYEIIGEAEIKEDGCGHYSLMEGVVVIVYRGKYGPLWVRPRAEFNDGRFEIINQDNEEKEETT